MYFPGSRCSCAEQIAGRDRIQGNRVRAIYANGIRDFRSRKYGLVPWKDIGSFEFVETKGNYFLYYFPRDPAKFHQPSSKFGQWLYKKVKFKILVSLQNMAVNISELSVFMTTMIAAHAPTQPQAIQAQAKA